MNARGRPGYMDIGDWMWTLGGLALALGEEGPGGMAHPWIVVIGCALMLWQWLRAIAFAHERAIVTTDDLSIRERRHGEVEEYLRRARDGYVRGDLEIEDLERSVEHVLHGRGPLGADGRIITCTPTIR